MMRILARQWLPQAVIITGLSLLIYAAVQQEYRGSLNDPQMQIAEDGAAALAAGGMPASLVQRGVSPIDAAQSLAPWVAVYDEQGNPLESSAVLDGKPPVPPPGVFAVAREQGNNLPHNTWQPALGVRIALVLVHFTNPSAPAHLPTARLRATRGQATSAAQAGSSLSSGFVAAGRTMSVVEARENSVFALVAAMWFVIMTITLCLSALSAWLRKRSLH